MDGTLQVTLREAPDLPSTFVLVGGRFRGLRRDAQCDCSTLAEAAGDLDRVLAAGQIALPETVHELPGS